MLFIIVHMCVHMRVFFLHYFLFFNTKSKLGKIIFTIVGNKEAENICRSIYVGEVTEATGRADSSFSSLHALRLAPVVRSCKQFTRS
jgi:hypothetical protein